MRILNRGLIPEGIFGDEREVWIQSSRAIPATVCLIFLDAELYLERVGGAAILNQAQEDARLPRLDTVFLSSRNAAARHADFTCNAEFSRALATELPRWIERTTRTAYERYLLCGLSLSGLCAAYTAVEFPEIFAGALCQSPSAWWNDEWLAASLAGRRSEAGRFWVSVGDAELETDVTHPPTGLRQKTSQVASVRRLASALQNAGHIIHFSEYQGGHDPKCWAEELAAALEWLTRPLSQPLAARPLNEGDSFRKR
jgi:enterochelin esterase family protein